MFLKLSKGWEIVSFFIVCNFVNMVRVYLVIHLVKYFYALLSLSKSLQFEGIKNERLEVVRTLPNPSKSPPASFKIHPNKVKAQICAKIQEFVQIPN